MVSSSAAQTVVSLVIGAMVAVMIGVVIDVALGRQLVAGAAVAAVRGQRASAVSEDDEVQQGNGEGQNGWRLEDAVHQRFASRQREQGGGDDDGGAAAEHDDGEEDVGPHRAHKYGRRQEARHQQQEGCPEVAVHELPRLKHDSERVSTNRHAQTQPAVHGGDGRRVQLMQRIRQIGGRHASVYGGTNAAGVTGMVDIALNVANIRQALHLSVEIQRAHSGG